MFARGRAAWKVKRGMAAADRLPPGTQCDGASRAAGPGLTRDRLLGWGPLVTGYGAKTCRMWGQALLAAGCGAGAPLCQAVGLGPTCDKLRGRNLPVTGSGVGPLPLAAGCGAWCLIVTDCGASALL